MLRDELKVAMALAGQLVYKSFCFVFFLIVWFPPCYLKPSNLGTVRCMAKKKKSELEMKRASGENCWEYYIDQLVEYCTPVNTITEVLMGWSV